jgi:hypothetical protein
MTHRTKLEMFPRVAALGGALVLGCGGSNDRGVPAGGDAGAVGNAGVADTGVPFNDETDYTETKTITMSPFPVPAGTEAFYCQNFANPWGKQVDIKTYALDMSEGSHHMFPFYLSNATDGDVAPCPAGGLTFGAFTFTAQSPNAVLTFPDTVGATIPTTTGFQMMAHFLNTTSEEITAHVSLTIYVAKPGVVTNRAGVIYDNNIRMTVPATGQPYVSTESNAIPQDVNILMSASHMHKFGTNFIATATTPDDGGTDGGTLTLYQTTSWDQPKALNYSPPLFLPRGTTITWSCTDVNTTGQELTFGEYAQTNVMCISIHIFYPVSDITNPIIGNAPGIGGL